MPSTWSHTFDNPSFKGTITLNTGLYIDGKFVDPVDKETIDVVDPTNGKVLTPVAAGSYKDVNIAVEAAKKAYKTVWGLKCPGKERGRLMAKLADLMEKHQDELSAIEVLNGGKMFGAAKGFDVYEATYTIRYYAGWADKIHGTTIETTENKMAYTRHEPYGVVGCIIPWNFPLLMATWKLGPALATGNTVVLKPSEMTPFSILRLAELAQEAGFPPGVLNIVNGYGNTVGQAITEHPKIEKVAFTGSTLTGRKILKAAAETNMKTVTLELGGKSPTIIFDDANLEQTLKWASMGVYGNMGQSCASASRIFVQEGIYDRFLEGFTAIAKQLGESTGNGFDPKSGHGPQISQTQFDRVMGFINAGKKDGAKVAIGGERLGTEGYFIQPTVFTDVKPNMSIMQEEIFGPVASVVKFKDDAEVIELANDVVYGLGANIFTETTSRAMRVAHALESGSVWVNCAQQTEMNVPFGGYKASGNGRELGQYAIDTYTQVKAVHINIGQKL